MIKVVSRAEYFREYRKRKRNLLQQQQAQQVTVQNVAQQPMTPSSRLRMATMTKSMERVPTQVLSIRIPARYIDQLLQIQIDLAANERRVYSLSRIASNIVRNWLDSLTESEHTATCSK